MSESSGERHRGHVYRCHLGGEHGFELILRLYAGDDGRDKGRSLLVAFCRGAEVDELVDEAVDEICIRRTESFLDRLLIDRDGAALDL